MCRSVMITGSNKRIMRTIKPLTCTGLVMFLLGLHLAVLLLFDFKPKPRKVPAYPEALSLTFDMTVPEAIAEEVMREAAATVPSPEPAPIPPQTLPEEPPEQVVPAPAEPQAVQSVPAQTIKTSVNSSSAAPIKTETVPVGTTTKPNPDRGLSESDYMSLIIGKLEKHKIYPLSLRKRGIQRDAAITFTIRHNGKAADISAADTGTHRLLLQAAIQTVKAAEPFPVRENSNADYTMRVTIRYRLEE